MLFDTDLTAYHHIYCHCICIQQWRQGEAIQQDYTIVFPPLFGFVMKQETRGPCSVVLDVLNQWFLNFLQSRTPSDI